MEAQWSKLGPIQRDLVLTSIDVGDHDYFDQMVQEFNVNVNEMVRIWHGGRRLPATLLIYAILKNKPDFVNLLISKHKASVSILCRKDFVKAENKTTALQTALEANCSPLIINALRNELGVGAPDLKTINKDVKDRIRIEDALQQKNFKAVLKLLQSYIGPYTTSENFLHLVNETKIYHTQIKREVRDLHCILVALLSRNFNINQLVRARNQDGDHFRTLTDEDGLEFGLIHIIAANGNLYLLRFLLSRKALKINQPASTSGKTALHFAIVADNLEAFKLLIENGASLREWEGDSAEVCEGDGRKIFDFASSSGSVRICRYLSDATGIHPVEFINSYLSRSDFDSACTLLDLIPPDCCHLSHLNFEPLRNTWILNNFDDDLKKFFLKCLNLGVSISKIFPDPGNGLYDALINNRSSLFDFLFENTTILNSEPHASGFYLIHLAAQYSVKIEEILTHFPQQINEKTAGGLSALHVAIWYEKLDAVDILLKKGALLNCGAPWSGLKEELKLKFTTRFSYLVHLVKMKNNGEDRLATVEEVEDCFLQVLGDTVISPLQLAFAVNNEPITRRLLDSSTLIKAKNLTEFHFSMISGNTSLALLAVNNLEKEVSLKNCETLGFPSLQIWANTKRRWSDDENGVIDLLLAVIDRDYDLKFENSQSWMLLSILHAYLTSTPARNVQVLDLLLSNGLTIGRKESISAEALMNSELLPRLLRSNFDATRVNFQHYRYCMDDADLLILLRKAGAKIPSDFSLNCTPQGPDLNHPGLRMAGVLYLASVRAEFEIFCDGLEFARRSLISLQDQSRISLRKDRSLMGAINHGVIPCPERIRRYLRFERESGPISMECLQLDRPRPTRQMMPEISSAVFRNKKDLELDIDFNLPLFQRENFVRVLGDMEQEQEEDFNGHDDWIDSSDSDDELLGVLHG